MVPFLTPTVAPQNEVQQEAFDALDEILEEKSPSRAVCWAIKQHKIITDKKELQEVRQLLQGAYKGRALRNWTLVTICAKQVWCVGCYMMQMLATFYNFQLLIEAEFSHLVEDLIGFVKGLGNSPNPTDSSKEATHATVVLQAVEDLLEVANNQRLHKVNLYICNIRVIIILKFVLLYLGSAVHAYRCACSWERGFGSCTCRC